MKSFEKIVFNILFLGNIGVGKTSIIKRYINNDYYNITCSTIGVDFFIKTIEKDNKIYKMHIWDAAGNEKFTPLLYSYYKESALAVLVYDMTDTESFIEIENWINKYYTINNINKSILIVGNKSDLIRKKHVSSEIGEQLAAKYNTKYIEVSSKLNLNIDEIFNKIIENIDLINENMKLNNSKYNKYKGIKLYLENEKDLLINDYGTMSSTTCLMDKKDEKEKKCNSCCNIL